MLSIGVWALFRALEVGSIQIPDKILWAKIEYICIALISVFWFIFILQYTHQEKRISYWWVVSLIAFPILTAYVAITDEKHRWLWERIIPKFDEPGSPLSYTHGWWFYLRLIFFLIMLVGVIILIRKTLIPPKSSAVKALLLLTALIPPLIGNLIYQAEFFPGLSAHILIMVGFVTSGLFLIWGIYYFQSLEAVSLSRDVIIDKMSEGVIVLDRHDRIHNINSTAMNMLGLTSRDAKRKSLNDIVELWPGLAVSFRVPNEIETEVKINGDAPRVLSLRTTNLYDKDGQTTGRMIVWRDITQYRQVESTLRDSEARFKALFQGAPDAIIITDKQTE
jgi:PAS domain-containing protein